jgi:hypothetical protein
MAELVEPEPIVLDRGRVPGARLGDRHREDRLVPMDDIQGEDDRDVQPRLQGRRDEYEGVP